jgi:hypothetical protein
MRKYIRHPSDIPIELNIENVSDEQREFLNNVSLGGLSFHSKVKLDIGSIVSISIPVIQPSFKAKGRVAWCTGGDRYYDIGIEILDRDQVFHTRMVEQICHIEHYKRKVIETEGRKLSGEEAAMEWISKFAANFPDVDIDE